MSRSLIYLLCYSFGFYHYTLSIDKCYKVRRFLGVSVAIISWLFWFPHFHNWGQNVMVKFNKFWRWHYEERRDDKVDRKYYRTTKAKEDLVIVLVPDVCIGRGSKIRSRNVALKKKERGRAIGNNLQDIRDSAEIEAIWKWKIRWINTSYIPSTAITLWAYKTFHWKH